MIPRKIHYCWFGRGKKPYLIRKCIESWRKVMPDYEIKEWNEDNFDVNSIPFVKQAYEEKKWAFVADVCRFYACYTEGGIYLDTDVEVFRRFDEFLNDDFFAGTEVRLRPDGSEYITLDASAFGCVKGNKYIGLCLEWYKDKPFYKPDGSISGGVVQGVATNIMEPFGYKRLNEEQLLESVHIYPNTVFANITTPYSINTIYSLHHFDGSWTDSSSRGFLFKFCREHDLMHWYRFCENIKHRILCFGKKN